WLKSLSRGQDQLWRAHRFAIQRRREPVPVAQRKSKEGFGMTPAAVTAQQLDTIRDLAAQWGKIVARRAFRDAGPGLGGGLLALEQVAAAAARGLTEGTLAALLEQQAQALPADPPGPDCGQRCAVRREPRPLVAHGGTLSYREPVCYCPACRRDFFPPAA